MRRALSVTLLACALAAPLPARSTASVSLGVVLPQSGTDGAAALQLREAIRLAAEDLNAGGTHVTLRAPDRRALAVRNPHRDEGSDNDADVAAAPALAAALAREGAVAILGPLRANVAAAMLPRLRALHLAAISATATGPSVAGSPLFRLTPSDEQLATAAYARMRRAFGPRACVLDDGTQTGGARARAFLSIAPGSRRASVVSGRSAAAERSCVRAADGVYAAAQGAEPVFASAAAVRAIGAGRLVLAMSHRDFDPAAFARAALYRAVPAPIARGARIDAVAARYRLRARIAASDDALRAYASVEIAARAAREAPARASLAAALRSRAFPTTIGTFRFDGRGDPVGAAIAIRRL